MQTQNFFAGEWHDAKEKITSINPSDTKDVIGHFARAESSHTQQALDAAQQAQPIWAACGLEQKQNALHAVGEELMRRADELGELLSREEGKPRAEGVGEVFRAGQFFTYYAAATLRQIGDNADSVRPDIDIDIRREPVGVVAVISPWNFPLAAACWKIAPALAFGNAVVWKPSPLTPAIAAAFADIVARQNLPHGVFNLLMGGDDTGQELVQSPAVDAISFTGSLAAGRLIAAAAARHLTKLQMEMGSKNPLVVMDDADMETAVRCAAAGAYGGSGQKCTASSRLIVHRRVLDEFIAQLTAATAALRVGHALAENTQIGPAVSAEQLQANLSYLKLAQDEGARLVVGGEPLSLTTDGYYLSPALFVDSDNTMRINREEMFAPIACVIAVDSYEEALTLANDTEYGLVSGIITRSLARATHFRRHSKSGCVMVNLPTAGTDYHVPFGGRKNSSYGAREQGTYAREFYTVVKTAYTFAGTPT